jgi:hypothetical protein
MAHHTQSARSALIYIYAALISDTADNLQLNDDNTGIPVGSPVPHHSAPPCTSAQWLAAPRLRLNPKSLRRGWSHMVYRCIAAVEGNTSDE